MNKTIGFALSLGCLLLAMGCETAPKRSGGVSTSVSIIGMESSAVDCLRRAIAYDANPVVRVQAIEAFEAGGCSDALPWIRSALLDDHPAVRFAACLTLGMMKDERARDRLELLVQDEDRSVRVAALYALHRLGDTRRTGLMASYLLEDDSPAVRRNTALTMGLMKEPSVVKMLARAMKDRDQGVRDIALESMAKLGNEEARQELVFKANSGVGSEEVMALLALAELRNPVLEDVFALKLDSSAHLETKLAAICGIGLLGGDGGFDLALKSLNFSTSAAREQGDTPFDQTLRTRANWRHARSARSGGGKRWKS